MRPGDPVPADRGAARGASSDIKGLVVASPANPTGTMLLPAELAAIAAWCEEHGVQLISDEIYHGIEYAPLAGEPPLSRSAWETSREAVVFSSFSKYFSMTGWRIGWMLVPERLRRPVDVLTGNFTICPPAIAQHARSRRSTTRRTPSSTATSRGTPATARCCWTACPGWASTGSRPADGAFYVYADVGHLTDDSMAFCHDLLAEHRRRRRARHRLRHRGRRPVHPVQLRREA